MERWYYWYDEYGEYHKELLDDNSYEARLISSNSYDFRNGKKDVDQLTYKDLVDQTTQNNLWSAEQAQKQMDFQREMYKKSLDFNENQSAIDRAFQQQSADRAMEFSSAEAEQNRQWQEYMSSTAHQREMSDLKAAGLNPVLAANNGAAVGSGATASSAQAAGHAASSSGSPSGSKADPDRNGTAAIASLLGKMLDNQVEREKMTVSAETARDTADMYTAATRYAAELAMIASEYSADKHFEGTKYSADTTYASYLNNPLNALGHELGEFFTAFGHSGYSAEQAGYSLGSLLDKVREFGSKIAKSGTSDSFKGESSKERTIRYIDTAGTGVKKRTFGDSAFGKWLGSFF